MVCNMKPIVWLGQAKRYATQLEFMVILRQTMAELFDFAGWTCLMHSHAVFI